MITLVNKNKFNGTLELFGLSTDQKPIDIYIENGTEYRVTNASSFYCIDTKTVFLFDQTNTEWIEQ